MWKTVLVSILVALPAQALAFGDARAVVEDARDGKLERMSLIESAIQLSGPISDSQREAILFRFAKMVTSVREDSSVNSTDRARVDLFIKKLHFKVLNGPFDAESCQVDDAFQTGRYNCVISLILALEYCRREKISANAMQAGNHVWLRTSGGEIADVETTRLVVNDEMRKGAVVISDAQLLTRLLYNQARHGHQLGNFEEAAKRLEWCLLIDPTFEPAERNLRIVLGNWMAAAEVDGRYAEAVAVSNRAMVRFPSDQEFRQNSAHLQQNWNRWRDSAELKNVTPLTTP